ncbi:MAG: GerMN domain-containing protein [Sphingomicrobium sp.]
MPRLRCISIVALLALSVSLLPPSFISQAQGGPTIATRFATYYQSHQGLRLLGNPVSGLAFGNGYPVQYFEKARIEDHRGEIANPDWAFAYGLLTAEMMASVNANVISVSNTSLKYSDLKAAADSKLRQTPPAGFKGGTVAVGESGGAFVPFDSGLGIAPGYVVPAMFWTYINRKDLFPGGWLHDIGLPMTSALPATVVKGDQTRQITLQAFERTVLSFNANNPSSFQVERANIGQDVMSTWVPMRESAVAEITTPAQGQRVTLPLHITARIHDPFKQVEARLEWADGTVLTDTLPVIWEGDSGLIIGSIDWLTEGAPPQPTTKTAALVLRPANSNIVLERVEGLTVLPFDDPDTQAIKVFWADEERVEAITHTIPRTEGVGRAALEELLWGPGPRVTAFPGFNTAIPTPKEIAAYPGKRSYWGPRVTLRSLTIENGVATANFSEEINAYGGGSTRVKVIRDQITNTLKQFPTIREVRIAVEGKTEGALQP